MLTDVARDGELLLPLDLCPLGTDELRTVELPALLVDNERFCEALLRTIVLLFDLLEAALRVAVEEAETEPLERETLDDVELRLALVDDAEAER